MWRNSITYNRLRFAIIEHVHYKPCAKYECGFVVDFYFVPVSVMMDQ